MSARRVVTMCGVFAVALDACGFTADPGAPARDATPGADTAGSEAGAAPCANGVRDGAELGIDCGASCLQDCTAVFEPDRDALAIFELNGDLGDSSGNHRDATLIAGSFVATSWGMGLAVDGDPTQGFSWAGYTNLLVHPYTIELVVRPASVSCYKKLIGPSDQSDAGWYYCKSFRSWPEQQGVGPTLAANERHYFAIVSTSSTAIDVYVQGVKVGTTASFTAPPEALIFLRDDTVTQRTENLAGAIDAVRISSRARTPTEIAAINARLAAQP